MLAQWTLITFWCGGAAGRRGKIHRRLSPRTRLAICKFSAKLIGARLYISRCEWNLCADQSRNDARNVHVDRNLTSAEPNRRNGACSIWADARELHQCFNVCGETTSRNSGGITLTLTGRYRRCTDRRGRCSG